MIVLLTSTPTERREAALAGLARFLEIIRRSFHVLPARYQSVWNAQRAVGRFVVGLADLLRLQQRFDALVRNKRDARRQLHSYFGASKVDARNLP